MTKKPVAGNEKKILIVDDNVKNLYFLEVILQSDGYEVIVAHNGIEALQILRKTEIDGIVSDILMPKMDGFQLIRGCKKDPFLRNIPFIFYTATYTGKMDEEFGLSLGAIRYIIKPSEPEVLFQHIKEAFSDHARSPRDFSTWSLPDDETFAREYASRVGLKLETKEHLLKESEEKFHLLYQNSMDAILLTSPDGSIQAANPATCAMFQQTEEDIIRNGRTGLVDTTDPRLPVALAECTRDGRFKGELTFLRKDGTRFFGEVSSNLFTDRNGQTRSSMIIRDITDRKRAEEALQKSEERYHNVVEDQTEYICRFLPDGTHIFVNNAYCRYFDKKREDIIGHRFRPVIHPEDREIVARHLASITPEHPVMDIDHRIIMTDGSIRWQRWNDRAIFDPDGRVIEYQSVGRDITVQKELEKELVYHTQELRQFSISLTAANRNLNLLSSITRHDITNQLTVLVGHLRILEKKQPDTSFSEHFNKINTSAQRISAMLRFTKEYEKIGVNAPIWQECLTIVDIAAIQAPLGKIMVKNELPAGAEVYADPLVVKVFYNLMDNAIRYGGKITTIRFSVEGRDGDHIVVCEDDGMGVPAEEKEKIFERGFGKNTGLGLTLSKEILSITGITIRENGEPGRGARFEMTVPKGAWRMTGNGA